MILKTKYHGEIEYNEEHIISFNKGIPGFEDLNKFILFPSQENELFSILHSTQDENIGLVVLSPFTIMQDYNVELGENIVNDLGIEKEEDVVLLNTVTLSSSIEKITVNLKAPVVINMKNKLGEQIILDDEKYLIKFPLFKE